MIPTFIGITLLTFAFIHMIHGDPVTIMAGERRLSQERHAKMMSQLGLDQPLWQQICKLYLRRVTRRFGHFLKKSFIRLG